MNYPNGVYIAFNLSRETEENIKKYCEENLPDMEMNEDLHCTLVYSKKPHEPRIKRDHCRCSGKPKKFSIFGEDDKSLVLEIDSEELKKMNHEKMKEHDFVSDFDEYKPHVTFVYGGAGEVDLEKLPPVDFPIEMEHQIVEGLDEEAMDSDKEEEKEGYETIGFSM